MDAPSASAPPRKIIYVDEAAAAVAAPQDAIEPSFTDTIPRTPIVQLPQNTPSLVQGGVQSTSLDNNHNQDAHFEQHQRQFNEHLQNLEENGRTGGLIRQEDLGSEAELEYDDDDDDEGDVGGQQAGGGGAERRKAPSLTRSSSTSSMSTQDLIIMDPIGLKLSYFLKNDDTTVAAFLRHMDEKMSKIEIHLKHICDIMESKRK